MMKTLVITLFGAIIALVSADANANDYYGRQKVVYHIAFDGGEDAKPYLQALGNVKNHIEAVGPSNIDVEIVILGDGMGLLKQARNEPQLQSRIKALKAQSVKFDVCNNTLTNRKINYETELFDVSPKDIVPAGVAELSRLQQKGYTYIRP